MKPITPQELLSAAEYEEQRIDIRQRIIALKKRRRITVGEYITLVFENRETIAFQIQEMVRTERIFSPEKIQEECDVYNTLLPETDELSATLFIEITEEDKIHELLDSFQGIDNSQIVAICTDRDKIFANFESGHSKKDKISAVHFVRFLTTPSFRDYLTQSETSVFLTIEHPNYQTKALIPQEMKEEWIQDLQ